ncbi:MAG: histidyl-tRNA synthetase [Candidatus Berkelbacteria bacterium Athens1014_28]|uniref:Histidine--tRNA ligase n=1 Tax=Candidatus Berkelbacteria bacterium Athens1014_28 TaxID=2017145 RepID=A0A554LPL8_9BACT|nr:MAG: histidyl-tRNA synthetase [Candidatus Berkelbacteria bacterium Athens1014_28]
MYLTLIGATIERVMENKTYQKPRGTRDILPEEQIYWRYLNSCAEDTLFGLGFSKIDTPIFEDKDIFVRGIGTATDIVEKEIFSISESGDDDPKYALRPEGTAGVVRAYIENGMSSWPQPVRLFYTGQMFRRERPQQGRLREHRQIGLEILGDPSAKSDFLAIISALEILKKSGFSDFIVSINSIGCPQCRPKYIDKLKEYYSKKLKDSCEDCQRRFNLNPLRLLDCKNDDCQKIKEDAPQILDFLCKECQDHFQDILGYLDDFDIKFLLDTKLVRGLDYYTKTVFEISAIGDESRKTTLCGGGRYDSLVSTLGGIATPAVGWGMGADRVIEELKKNKIVPAKIRGIEVYLIQLGKTTKPICKKIYNELKKSAINVYYIPSDDSLRSLLKDAAKLKVPTTVIIGQQEASAGRAIVRDLNSGSQEELKIAEAIEKIKKKYSRQKPAC